MKPDLIDDLFPSGSLETLNPWGAYVANIGRRLSTESEAVQKAMWAAFEKWCIQNQIDSGTLTKAQLNAYLKSRDGKVPASELGPRYTLHLVTLIGRVLNVSDTGSFSASHPAVEELLDSDPDIKYADAGGRIPVPEYLSDTQDRTLVSFLESSVPSPGTRVSAIIQQQAKWHEMRNRAAVALQRGAGLTPLEIRNLKMSSVFLDSDPAKGPWKVRAPASGRVHAHEAPLARWARPLLTYWLELRSSLDISGEWLFPSTRTGKQWQKVSHFNSVEAVFDSAGLLGLTGGSYRLRHTFALRQLSRPEISEAKVAGWMGVEEKEIKRYRGVILVPEDVA